MRSMMTEPCFVKLSARSCKDSILRSTFFKDVLRKEIAGMKDQSPNEWLKAYVRAQCLAMCRKTAEDALEDMLQSRLDFLYGVNIY
jgi:hypothetical protein